MYRWQLEIDLTSKSIIYACRNQHWHCSSLFFDITLSKCPILSQRDKMSFKKCDLPVAEKTLIYSFVMCMKPKQQHKPDQKAPFM